MEKEDTQRNDRFCPQLNALRDTKHPLQEVIVREYEIKTEKKAFRKPSLMICTVVHDLLKHTEKAAFTIDLHGGLWFIETHSFYRD